MEHAVLYDNIYVAKYFMKSSQIWRVLKYHAAVLYNKLNLIFIDMALNIFEYTYKLI